MNPNTGPAVSGLPADKLLAAALSSMPVSSPAFAWVPPAVDEIAPWFPGYEILSLVGRGAMGAVYRAVQRKLERPVAIKLLPAELAAREGVEARFEREARALAKLNHPGIVALHDFGRTEGGHLFIVMEYVDGTDLSRLLLAEGGGLSVDHALEIVGQVCDALQYAHSRGCVHRDIKPGNVLVDKEGRVKIADFGLAKFVAVPDASATLESRATLTGQALGTPDYTAPEQLKGGPVDHRADIYSLGVMFYEMLTGELPRGAWPPPSQCTAAPARLDEVVTRAMQTEPERRYQQASEVKAAAIAAEAPAPESAANYSSVNRVMIWLMLAFIVASALITPTTDAITMMMLAGPFIALAIYFKLKRRPAGMVSLLLAGIAMGALLLLWIVQLDHFGPNQSKAKRDHTSQISPAPQMSGHARKELETLLENLSGLEQRKFPQQYWTEEEQAQEGDYLAGLQKELITLEEAGYSTIEPGVSEARKRLEPLLAAHEARKLPGIAPGNCVSPKPRAAGGTHVIPDGTEILPGLTARVWRGVHGMDAAVYYLQVAAPREEQPVEWGVEPALEKHPDFWPLRMPLERPSLPAATPQSNAELEWIRKTWPRESSAEGIGLVVAELSEECVRHEQYLNWTHWSPSSAVPIPWARGEPSTTPGATHGRIILKGGECYTVFDTVPRPQLFGDKLPWAVAWAARTLSHASLPRLYAQICRPLDAPGEDIVYPEWHRAVLDLISDYSARECVAYIEDIARTNPPWYSWQRDFSNLQVCKEWQAHRNTGEGIPFHRWREGRILITEFVCSREVAEAIAKSCGGVLPRPRNQEELDALAKLAPEKWPLHTGFTDHTKLNAMRMVPRAEAVNDEPSAQDGKTMPRAASGIIVLKYPNGGMLRKGASRALLALYYPDVRDDAAVAEARMAAMRESIKEQEKKVEAAKAAMLEVAKRYRIVDQGLPPPEQPEGTNTVGPSDLIDINESRRRQNEYSESKELFQSESAILKSMNEFLRDVEDGSAP